MAIKISDLVTPLDKGAVLADIYDLLGLFGLTTTALQPGEPIPVVLDSVVAWAVDDIWNPFVVSALRAPFLDYATGDWLTLVAALVYNRPRIPAQAGTAIVGVENRSAVSGLVTINPGTLRFRNKNSGKTYSNTTVATVAQWTGAGPYPTATPVMTFEADEVGTGSNAQPGEIDPFPSVPVTSPSVGLYEVPIAPAVTSPLFLGSDEELDANLVVRCRAAVGELTPGSPGLAYQSVARDPIGAFTRRQMIPPASWGPAPPAISRVRVVEPGGGIVDVYLASSSGPAGGDAMTPDTDVFKANVALQLFCVPPGAVCFVQAATPLNLALGTITLDVAAESNVTAADAIATATAAIDAFFSTLPIGGARNIGSPQGYVFFAKVIGTLVQGNGVETAVCSLFSADQAVVSNQVVVPTYVFAVNIVTQGA